MSASDKEAHLARTLLHLTILQELLRQLRAGCRLEVYVRERERNRECGREQVSVRARPVLKDGQRNDFQSRKMEHQTRSRDVS